MSGDSYRLNGGSQDRTSSTESAGATGNIIAHESLGLHFDENRIPSAQTVNFVAEC